MVTYAQAKELAEDWINAGVPRAALREVRVREFDAGFVCWAGEGGPRLVIARQGGASTLWPALPVNEVVQLFEETYGTPTEANPAGAAKPVVGDVEATSFRLSPPQWVKDAGEAAIAAEAARLGPPPGAEAEAEAEAAGAAEGEAGTEDDEPKVFTAPPASDRPAESAPTMLSAPPEGVTPPLPDAGSTEESATGEAGELGEPTGPGVPAGDAVSPVSADADELSLPGRPGTPAEQGMPGASPIPSVPGVTGVQEVPAVPGVPSGQGLPGAPAAAGGSGVPSFPGQSGVAAGAPPFSGQPGVPPVPGVPGGVPVPTGPDGVSVPVFPGAPGAMGVPPVPGVPSVAGGPGPSPYPFPGQAVPSVPSAADLAAAPPPPPGAVGVPLPPPGQSGPGVPPPPPGALLNQPGGQPAPTGGANPSAPPPPPPATLRTDTPAAGIEHEQTQLAQAVPTPGHQQGGQPLPGVGVPLTAPTVGGVGGPGGVLPAGAFVLGGVPPVTSGPIPVPPAQGGTGGYGYPNVPQAAVPSIGPGSVAVVSYRGPDGSEQKVIHRSEPGTPHPEWKAMQDLRRLNVPADQVLELHTDLECCELPGGYCGRMVRAAWPNVRISHTAPYGRDHQARQAGMAVLLEHLDQLHQVAAAPQRPRPVRVPLPGPGTIPALPPIAPQQLSAELAQYFQANLFRFEPRAVSRQGVPEAVAQTLTWAGLPREYPPFFWAQAQEGRPIPTLAELAAERGLPAGPDFGGYLVLGNDYGRQLCVQYGTAAVVAVDLDPGSGEPPRFVNTGVPEFARCLALLGRMWPLRYGLTPEQAARWTTDFQAQLAAVDPAALQTPETWWGVLVEQFWDGVM